MADSQKSTPNPLGSYLRGLARGLGPDLLGGPVDLARDALNLGIAGVGYAGHKSGLLKEPLPLIESGALGDSDWWAKLTNVSDDGSGQYTAGRLTPLATAGVKVAGEGAKRLVNALVSRSAPSRSGPLPSAKSQEGAIRIGGDPELMLSHSTSLSNLSGAQGRGKGVIELSNPSIGITRNSVLDKFGYGPDSVQLIPRIGAFDPATSSSTLLNRDGYTSRWTQHSTKTTGNAVSSPDVPFYEAEGGSLIKGIKTLARLEDPLIGLTIDKSVPPEDAGRIRGALWRLARKDESALKDISASYAGLTNDEIPNWAKMWGPDKYKEMVDDFALISRNSDQILKPGKNIDRKQAAKDRMTDRLFPSASGKSIAGLEGKGKLKHLSPEDLASFDGDVTENFTRDMAIRGSPAFRSFFEFERSPLGSALLTRPGQPVDHNFRMQQIFEQALEKQMPRLAREAEENGVDAAEMLQPLLKFQYQGMSEAQMKKRWMQMLDGDELEDVSDAAKLQSFKEFPNILRALQEGRKGAIRSPSEYAELKVHGPVAITPENFAGAIIRSPVRTEEEQRVVEALSRSGMWIQGANNFHNMSRGEMVRHGLIPDTNESSVQKFWFNFADQMQKEAGPARKSRMFER